MLPILIIIITLPIIIGIVAVSPFEPPEIVEEEIPETAVEESPESTRYAIMILLTIVWTFFIARMLRIMFITRSKSRIRK